MGNNFNSIKLGTSQFDFRPYTTCGTAAATAAKTVSVANFSLFNGASVTVKFTYANTAASPTLNVNSTDAKSIFYNGVALPSTQYWAAGAVIEFIYDGTNWNVNGTMKDNNTTYSAATASASGLVSTDAQTFGGTKTFSAINTNTINDNGGTLYITNNNTNNNSNDYIRIESTNGQININSKLGCAIESEDALNLYGKTVTLGGPSATNSIVLNGKINKLYLPKSSGGTTYGLGSSGQVLTSNGSSVYWSSTVNQATNATNATNASKADSLSNEVLIDGWSFDGSEDITHLMICSTANNVQNKICYPVNGGVEPVQGTKITIWFLQNNVAQNPTISLGTLGTAPIYFAGQPLTSGNFWQSNTVIDFVYFNDRWNLVGNVSTIQTSDINMKNIKNDKTNLTLDGIANAPSKIFTFKNDSDEVEHIGTIAQYWAPLVQQSVKGSDGDYSMDYAPLALCSAITLAREVVELKEKIKELENKLLEKK